MFKFLKDKLKKVVSKFSKEVKQEKEEVKEEVQEEIKEVPEVKEETDIVEEIIKESKSPVVKVEEPKVEEIKEKAVEDIIPPFEEKVPEPEITEDIQPEIKEEFKQPEIIEQIKEPEVKEEERIEVKEVEQPKFEKKGFFAKLKERITKTVISDKKFENFFDELEIILLENNVALEVIDKIKKDLSSEIVDQPMSKGKIEDIIKDKLRESIDSLFVENIDILKLIEKKKPFIICFVGINGSGKTTTMAKIAYYLMKNNLTVVLAAADTFRAASIEQLQVHADKLNVKMIKHDYGSDPAAVSFDAIKYAQAKSIDVVLIDTAGRMHSNVNLLDEMRKIIRVADPDLKIFVGEAITGNDCVEQASKFNESIEIDGIILTKADIDEKGGAMISVSYITKKPILFLGTGQDYGDLEIFDKEKVVEGLGL